MLPFFLNLLLSAFLAGFAASANAAGRSPPCQAAGIEVICGLQKPEDLALYGERHVLISQMGGMIKGAPGSLAVLDTRSNAYLEIYPLGRGAGTKAAPWGASDCPGEPGTELSPHGLHLSQREDGRWQLLVVNHGGRESVEFFEVIGSPDGEDGVKSLAWRGCAKASPEAFLNDTVALPDGGFLVTHMWKKSDSFFGTLLSAMGFKGQGHIYSWRPGEGFREVQGTEGLMPNGIALAPDGKTFFLNLSGDNLVQEVRLADGKKLRKVKVNSPDNSTWAPDGRLLVASLHMNMWNALRCFSNLDKPCPAAFEIVAISPENMEKKTVFSHEGPPMGAATVGLAVKDKLYLGSFAGERMLVVPYSPSAAPPPSPARQH